MVDMFVIDSECIYKAQKTGKKTNRCQKINVEKLFNNWLQTAIYLITYLTYPKRLMNINHRCAGQGCRTHDITGQN